MQPVTLIVDVLTQHWNFSVNTFFVSFGIEILKYVNVASKVVLFFASTFKAYWNEWMDRVYEILVLNMFKTLGDTKLHIRVIGKSAKLDLQINQWT